VTAVPSTRDTSGPICRVPGCGAALPATGHCRACEYRGRKYAALLEPPRAYCECSAPLVPRKPTTTRLPKRCPLCDKLAKRAQRRGIAIR